MQGNAHGSEKAEQQNETFPEKYDIFTKLSKCQATIVSVTLIFEKQTKQKEMPRDIHIEITTWYFGSDSTNLLGSDGLCGEFFGKASSMENYYFFLLEKAFKTFYFCIIQITEKFQNSDTPFNQFNHFIEVKSKPHKWRLSFYKAPKKSQLHNNPSSIHLHHQLYSVANDVKSWTPCSFPPLFGKSQSISLHSMFQADATGRSGLLQDPHSQTATTD